MLLDHCQSPTSQSSTAADRPSHHITMW